MTKTNIIALAPALARRRRVTAGTALLSWDNNFPRGIEDLWTGPFVPVGAAVVVPLFAA